MAFSSFANSSGNAMMGGSAGGAGGLVQGPDLPLIQTEGLGFLSTAGDSRVQLTPKWSPEPAPTASLLAIASRKGLVAAAGPDAIHLAATESVRKAFEAEKNGDSEVRPFQPQAKVPLSLRLSQIAFTADEKYLAASVESGGGLAVYDVQELLQGNTQPAFEINTSGETVRALIPNPSPDSAGLCAVVTSNGNLLMANLNERALVAGQNGLVLRSEVSCASWSTRGKQLVAGLADGSIQQMTPDGADKGQIPKPTSLGNFHVASLLWLENHLFLAIYNATNGEGSSVYQLITRQQAPGGAPPTFNFQKLTDPVEPWTNDKTPHHNLLRLKDFPPNLQDLLLVSSTCVEGIGMLTRSKSPLTSDRPAEEITNVFTTTELADDSKRAQLPMSEDLAETYPIGVSLDLSSKDKVYKPIPSDEIDYSPGPLPGLWALNNEGVLSCWWIVYNDSIRGGTSYPGLMSADTSATFSQPAQVATPNPAPASGLLSSSAFSNPNTNQSAFGGSPSTGPAFGGASTLGAKQSPWSSGNTPAFGSSSFGSAPAPPAPTLGNASGSSVFGSKPAAPAFGQASSMTLGQKASPWASGGASAATPAFGQPSFGSTGATPGKVFGSGGDSTTSPASGGFASFANKTGASAFSSLGVRTGAAGSSIFASKSTGASFAPSAPEVSMDSDTAFPPPSANKNAQASAFGSGPFVLGSTFKPDTTSANDNETPLAGGGSSLFGNGFGLSLKNASEEQTGATSKDEHMDTATPLAAPEKSNSIFGSSADPPKSTFASQNPSSAEKTSLFNTTPSASDKSKNPFAASTTPTATPAAEKANIFGKTASPAINNPFGQKPPSAGSSIFGTTSIFGGAAKKSMNSPLFGTAKVKEEDDKENLANIPEAPLPPDSTSKAPFSLGDLSASSSYSTISPDTESETVKPSTAQAENARLPPDFASNLKRQPEPEPAPSPPDLTKTKPKSIFESTPLPADFDITKATVAPPYSSDEDEEDEDEEEEDEDEDEEEEEEDVEEEDVDEEDEAASEGSGVDVAKDLSPSTSNVGGQTPGFTPQSSFGGMGGSTFSLASRPETQSRPLFGEMSRNAPSFPRPAPPSPRSPSPVRGPLSMLRSEGSRSVSAPGKASQLLGISQQRPAFGQSVPHRAPRATLDPNVEEQRKLVAKREAEAHKVLEDPEDAGIQELLHAPLEPTVHLGEFLAGQPTPSASNGKAPQAVPDAVEAVWKDINRMVDYVGLNSRTIRQFTLGHTETYKRTGRTKSDLENPEDWILIEAEDLGMMIDGELAQDLEDGRIKDTHGTVAAIEALSRDLAKLRAKEDDLRKIIASHVDPEQVAVVKSMPLSGEQAAQQNELRKSYQQFAKLLVAAEESLTVLRAKMASASGASGKTPVPTMEAVIRTINKMTKVAEKRSGDVDVLETQLRRLDLGPSIPGTRSREGSPFVGTPQKQGNARRSLIMSPERSIMRDSFASSVGSRTPLAAATPPRKKMSNYSEEEKQAVRRKKTRREAMFGILRGSLEKAGPNVQRLEDDD